MSSFLSPLLMSLFFSSFSVSCFSMCLPLSLFIFLTLYFSFFLLYALFFPGLGLCSLFCHERPERIAPIALLSWTTWVNRSWSLFCKEWWEQSRSLKKSEWAKSDGSDSLLGIKCGGKVKNIRKLQIFRVNCSFFGILQAIRLNHKWITHIAFFKEGSERFWANEQTSEFPTLLFPLSHSFIPYSLPLPPLSKNC